MRVFELARDLRVSSRMLLTLLRKMGVALHGDRDFVPSDDVSRLLARIERERRQRGFGTREAVRAALEDVRATHVRRRRSRRRIRRAASNDAQAVPVASAVAVEETPTSATEPADSELASGETADGSGRAPGSVSEAAALPASAAADGATELAEGAGSTGRHASNGEVPSPERRGTGAGHIRLRNGVAPGYGRPGRCRRGRGHRWRERRGRGPRGGARW